MSESETEDAEKLSETITKSLKGRAKHYKVTKPFAEKVSITRQDLLLLDNVVKSYDALLEIDRKLAVDHAAWITVCGKTSEQLDQENHKFSPKNMTDLFEQYCEVSDKVEEQFKQILIQFPEKTDVKTFLSKFKENTSTVRDFDLNSQCSGKGADYAKQKIPKLKDEITQEYERVSSENDLGAGSQVPLESLVESLDRLYKILDVDGKLDHLIRELEESDDVEDQVVAGYEKWQKEFVVKVGILRTTVKSRIKPISDGSKSTYSAHFKKQDPPKFSGDCLAYIEWKTK